MARSAFGRPVAFLATLLFAIVFLQAAPTRADEAVLLNGKLVPGTLRFGDGKLTFASIKPGELIPWSQIDRVEPARQSVSDLSIPFWWQARLINGDQFYCHVQEIESNAIVCDSSWFQNRRVRRGVVQALERPQGWCPLVLQDLGRDAHGWQETRETGETLTPVGLGGLALGPLTRGLQYAPDGPVPLGRIALVLKDTTGNGGKRWRFRLELETDKGKQSVSLTFGANARVDLQSPGLELRHQNGQISGSTIVVDIDSGEASFRVQVNGQLVGWTETGLKNVRLRSLVLDAAPDAPPPDGTARLTLHEFALARRLEPIPRPPSHPELDEAWLESGDQIFGQFQSLSARELGLAMRNATRRIPSRLIRGLYPRSAPVYSGAATTLWQFSLVDLAGAEPARLTGTIRSWDKSSVVIVHSLLGEVKVPAAHVRSVAQIHSSPIELRPEPNKVIKP